MVAGATDVVSDKQQKFSLHSSRGWKLKVKAAFEWLPGEGPLREIPLSDGC